MRGTPRSFAASGPETPSTPLPRRSCTSTATSGSPPGPRVTTWTWTTSWPATTPSTCTPPPTSSGCCARCLRPSPSRSSPPPRSARHAPQTGCSTRGWGCSWTRAGNCAALSDLDVLATTARGQGIQLVTVWHDRSQLEARYGAKASTILNNHRAKLFLSGLADLSALELGSRLIGDRQLVEPAPSIGSDGRHSLNESGLYRPLLPVEDLRRLRPGEGVLLYGHLRPTPIRLRPFYLPAERRRRRRLEDKAERHLRRGERRRERATMRARQRAEGDSRRIPVPQAEAGPRRPSLARRLNGWLAG